MFTSVIYVYIYIHIMYKYIHIMYKYIHIMYIYIYIYINCIVYICMYIYIFVYIDITSSLAALLSLQKRRPVTPSWLRRVHLLRRPGNGEGVSSQYHMKPYGDFHKWGTAKMDDKHKNPTKIDDLGVPLL